MRNDGASFCFCVRTNDAKKYNEHLATTSWTLAFAGTYLRKFDVPDSQGNTYYNKHAGARQFLADIGCPDQSIYVNDSMVSKPGTDTVGCTIGSKELAKADGTKTGKILIPVTVRGGGYESEWASNCTLGAGTPDEGRNGEAKGFSTAADQVVDAIDQYINKYELEDEIHDGKVVFWVSGFSRAGATANITSKRMVEMYADGSGKAGKNNRVFGYTCEAAKGGTEASLDPGEYLTDQVTTLSTETKDGIIWYTLDGSDPKTSETRTKYEGGQIAIDFDPDAGRTNITLKAYTERNDLWESSVATYVYEFTGEVEVPKGIVSVYDGKPQIGVEWRPFYTLVADEGSGATIDDEGNAVATNTGTYTVTAKIKDGYKWIIENDDLTTDEDESRTTTDDQTIEFSIEKAVNPLKVKGKKVKIKSKKLKKKNVRVKVSKCIRFVKKAQGTKSYKLISAKKGKKNFKKKFSVNAKTGKLTVKKK